MNAVPLPAIPAERSATFQMPPDIESGLEFMMTFWLDAPDWQCRWRLAEAFMSSMPVHNSDRCSFQTEATTRLITGLLENLGEREIRSVEAAALYLISLHPGWRAAARRFLNTRPETEFAQFMDEHPAWTLLAVAHASLFPVEESIG